MLTKRFAALGLAAALALPLGAACSKSSETSTSSNNNASSTTTTKVSSGGNGGGGGTPSTGDCVKAAQQFSTLAAQATSALVPGQNIDTAQLESQLNEIKGSVPADLQADMQTWADAYAQFINNVKELDLSNPQNLINSAGKLQDASKPLETTEFKQAEANIKAYFDKCSTATPSLSLPS